MVPMPTPERRAIFSIDTSYPRSAKTVRAVRRIRRIAPRPDFPAAFRGAVLRPGDHGYDTARVLDQGRAADEGPALIARCVDERDVATVLRYASDRGIPVAVRGGGHGSDGHAMPGGALVVDLSEMKAINVDPTTRVVRAQSGDLLGELDDAAQQHGLAVPAGTVSSTGVAGLTLGGGFGHLMRRYGATVDNLLACEFDQAADVPAKLPAYMGHRSA